jgi:hypothetical protein
MSAEAHPISKLAGTPISAMRLREALLVVSRSSSCCVKGTASAAPQYVGMEAASQAAEKSSLA